MYVWPKLARTSAGILSFCVKKIIYQPHGFVVVAAQAAEVEIELDYSLKKRSDRLTSTTEISRYFQSLAF